MAGKPVAGELYYALTGQLAEILRQLRQPHGYPFDPEELGSFLQRAVEGRFDDSNTIFVDRTAVVPCPDWAEKFLHPELQNTGPARYDITKDVELWLHDDQKNGGVTKGQVIHDYLTANNVLPSCINLADLLAIQKNGLTFFRKHFAGKVVCAWKSVVRHRGGDLYAPCLYACGGKVVLGWVWLESGWRGCLPTPRFRKSAAGGR